MQHSLHCTLDFMNDLRLDEVHTTFLDQWLVSFAMLQKKGLLREVCYDSVFAQITDTQDRLCRVYHMVLVSFQMISNCQPELSLSVIMECSSMPRSRTEPSDGSRADSPNHLGQTLTDAPLSIIHQSVFVTVATNVAQGYIFDCVFNREPILLRRHPPLQPSSSFTVLSWWSCERTRSTLCHVFLIFVFGKCSRPTSGLTLSFHF